MPFYPLAEMIRAQRKNDLIICEPIVKESKIADPNSVKLVSIDQSKEDTEAYFQPELPENFPGCAITQALLGIHGKERILSYSPSK